MKIHDKWINKIIHARMMKIKVCVMVIFMLLAFQIHHL